MSAGSLKAFNELLNDDKRTNLCKRILEIVKRSPCTIEQLVLSGFKWQTASARVSDLNSMGYVRFIISPTDQMSFIQYVSDENEREAIRKSVIEEKRRKWEKLGKRNGWIAKPDYRNLKLTFK